MKLIKYKTLCGNLNSGRAMDDNDTDMMSNIIEIQDIWNLLYKVNHLRLDLIVTERICI
jgi:hypothetical protein